MKFGEVIEALLADATKRYERAGWNGKEMYISLQVPDENSKMKQPYIYIVPVGGELVPWTASQPDLLSSDWEEVFA